MRPLVYIFQLNSVLVKNSFMNRVTIPSPLTTTKPNILNTYKSCLTRVEKFYYVNPKYVGNSWELLLFIHVTFLIKTIGRLNFEHWGPIYVLDLIYYLHIDHRYMAFLDWGIEKIFYTHYLFCLSVNYRCHRKEVNKKFSTYPRKS